MKNLAKRYKALPLRTRQLLGLAVVLGLFAALPLFILAILTQRFDIRNQAQVGNVCWNAVNISDGNYFWPDGCRGNYTENTQCSRDIPLLTPEEKTAYDNWVNEGRPDIPGCVSTEREDTGTPTGTNTCTTDADCGCALNQENQCEINNTSNLHGQCTAPDFCSGITGNCGPKCISGSCQLSCPTQVGGKQIMKFAVKFVGVNDDKAEGAKISIRFRANNGSIDRTTSAVAVTHLAQGIYEASIEIGENYLPHDGYLYAVFVKGEKHVSRRFCQNSGQNTRCTENGSITITAPSTNPTIQAFDFTGLPLEPGDLPTQDGVVNISDFNKVKTLMAKACSELTAEEKLTADLDYSGCVNVRDAFLMRQTLETRYDE